MASRFVSGGTLPGDETAARPMTTTTTTTTTSSSLLVPGPQSQPQAQAPVSSQTQSEWEAVQRRLEAERRQREEARKTSAEGRGSQSLFDVLQANKEAKQAAFEEANRIKNQFRALDDDEIDFLDTLRDEKRSEEDRVRRETEERLALFKKAQQSSGVAPVEEDMLGTGAGVEWAAAVSRKRKRDKEEKGIKGLKRRTSSSAKGEVKSTIEDGVANTATVKREGGVDEPPKVEVAAKPAPAKPKPGLVEYASDEDDD